MHLNHVFNEIRVFFAPLSRFNSKNEKNMTARCDAPHRTGLHKKVEISTLNEQTKRKKLGFGHLNKILGIRHLVGLAGACQARPAGVQPSRLVAAWSGPGGSKKVSLKCPISISAIS